MCAPSIKISDARHIFVCLKWHQNVNMAKSLFCKAIFPALKANYICIVCERISLCFRYLGVDSIQRYYPTSVENLILEIKRSYDSHMSAMWFPTMISRSWFTGRSGIFRWNGRVLYTRFLRIGYLMAVKNALIVSAWMEMLDDNGHR